MVMPHDIGHPDGKDTEVDAGVLLGVAHDISIQDPSKYTPETMRLIEESHAILWGIISTEKKKELCDER